MRSGKSGGTYAHLWPNRPREPARWYSLPDVCGVQGLVLIGQPRPIDQADIVEVGEPHPWDWSAAPTAWSLPADPAGAPPHG